MSGTYLDLAGWPRRSLFELYRRYDLPFFNVVTEVRVTELYQRAREPEGPSFFLATLYLSLRAANAQEAFRLRLREKGVWQHDVIHGGSTVLRPDETFGFGYFDFTRDYKQFESDGRRAIDEVRQDPGSLDPQDQRDDLIHYSVLPWIHFTSISHARRLNGTDSIPKIVFGKRQERSGEVWMPVSVEVHHALVDGLHVARFLEMFQIGLSAADL